MRTLDDVIKSLPADQQARIKARTEELVEELEDSVAVEAVPAVTKVERDLSCS